METGQNLRTIVLVTVSVLLGALLAPVAATATSSLVTLFDPRSDSRARIDNGDLRIGDGNGPVTVDGSVHSTSGLDNRQLVNLSLVGFVMGSEPVHTDTYTIPQGKRLVITTVSLHARCQGSGGERVYYADLKGDQPVRLAMQAVNESEGDPGEILTVQTATLAVDLAFRPQTSIHFEVDFFGGCVESYANGTVHGYLVPV